MWGKEGVHAMNEFCMIIEALISEIRAIGTRGIQSRTPSVSYLKRKFQEKSYPTQPLISMMAMVPHHYPNSRTNAPVSLHAYTDGITYAAYANISTVSIHVSLHPHQYQQIETKINTRLTQRSPNPLLSPPPCPCPNLNLGQLGNTLSSRTPNTSDTTQYLSPMYATDPICCPHTHSHVPNKNWPIPDATALASIVGVNAYK